MVLVGAHVEGGTPTANRKSENCGLTIPSAGSIPNDLRASKPDLKDPTTSYPHKLETQLPAPETIGYPTGVFLSIDERIGLELLNWREVLDMGSKQGGMVEENVVKLS